LLSNNLSTELTERQVLFDYAALEEASNVDALERLAHAT